MVILTLWVPRLANNNLNNVDAQVIKINEMITQGRNALIFKKFSQQFF